jgi:site-specific recombinase XerD
MARPFKKQVVRYYTPDGGRCSPDLPDAIKHVEESHKYYGLVPQPNGKRKAVPLCPDLGRSKQLLNKLLADAAMRQHGMADPYEAHRRRPLADHLDDFKAALLADNNTPKHARQTVTRAKKLLTGCKFTLITDVQASRVSEWLADERKAGRLTITTSNYYLRDTKSFFSWMIKDARIDRNPLAHLSPLNAEVEEHRQRRALEPDEYRRFLQAAEVGPQRCRLAGSDRFMLYLTASNTGLRNQELASLTPESFSLHGASPTVTVEASYSKHRRQDVQPIRQDLAELLREYLKGKPAGSPIWPGRWWYKAAKMVRADLKDARKAWIDEGGQDTEERKRREESDYLAYVSASGEVFDFYAQRGQMLTALEQAGVSLKTLQALARHSRVETTLKHYTRKPRLADTRAALDALPELPPNRTEMPADVLKATGTDGFGCTLVAHAVSNQGHPVASVGNEGERGGLIQERCNPLKCQRVTSPVISSHQEAPPGFEPGMADLQSAALNRLAKGPREVFWILPAAPASVNRSYPLREVGTPFARAGGLWYPARRNMLRSLHVSTREERLWRHASYPRNGCKRSITSPHSGVKSALGGPSESPTSTANSTFRRWSKSPRPLPPPSGLASRYDGRVRGHAMSVLTSVLNNLTYLIRRKLPSVSISN